MLLSVIKEESNFYIFARSEKGAKGLTQVMTKIWNEELKSEGIWDEELDVFDYKRSIKAGNYILNKYYTQTGSWEEALLKYVGGDKDYVRRVLSNYGQIKLLAKEG